ncbi:hypothetical protein [Mycolicibacter sinensis]|uniref:hypothetical protein n=1 Tax=Mycolicibacter sinensis (strain JDM601) TaxID=875328 RepID=UPI000A7D5F1A|nr:hypothetical protein [Mycolicibacter sinensis]
MATAGPAARGDLSYARDETRPAPWETTIGADLARADPDRDALVDVPPGRRWTDAQLSAAVRRPAGALPGAAVSARRRELSPDGRRQARKDEMRRQAIEHVQGG